MTRGASASNSALVSSLPGNNAAQDQWRVQLAFPSWSYVLWIGVDMACASRSLHPEGGAHLDLVLAARDRPRQTASGGAVVQACDRPGRRPLAWLGSGARRRRPQRTPCLSTRLGGPARASSVRTRRKMAFSRSSYASSHSGDARNSVAQYACAFTTAAVTPYLASTFCQVFFA